MSHTPSMAHFPAVASSHCIPSEKAELASTTAMPPYTSLMTAPSMTTTASSSGSTVSEADHPDHHVLGPPTEPLLPRSIDTTAGLAHSMASTDTMWTMKTPSFGASTDDTPSISSSFDFTDLPKQEHSVHHGLPLYNHHSTNPVFDNPFYLDTQDAKFVRTTIPESTDGLPWCDWPVSGPTDSWSHLIAADDHVWPSTGYQTCYWPGQEALLNTAVNAHTLQTIPPSSIEPHHQFQTTSTPSTSSPDLQHTAPVFTHPEPSNPHSHPHPQPHPHPHQHYHPYQSTSPAKPNTPPEPTPLIPSNPPPNDHRSPKEPIKASLHYTDTRNAFLIELKRRGLSYKDIKRIGGFKEAESTLRGRFRTLTKAKEQRVRKPKWLERDVSFTPTHLSHRCKHKHPRDDRVD